VICYRHLVDCTLARDAEAAARLRNYAFYSDTRTQSYQAIQAFKQPYLEFRGAKYRDRV